MFKKVIQENGIIPDIVVVNKPSTIISKEDKNKLSKEPAEKERMRRYLRERDLKKHLKGKTSIEGKESEDLKGIVPSKEEKDKVQLEEDLEKDSQLRHAVSLLSGWDVMVGTFKKQKQVGRPAHLTLGKIQ